VTEFNDEKWLRDLQLLCDINAPSKWLEYQTSGQQKRISGRSELFKWSCNYMRHSWETLTCAAFLPVTCFIRMDRHVFHFQMSELQR
jgi:hypothetical protein